MIHEQHPVLFFDDECVLCNFAVKRIIAVDKKGDFRFAALRGAYANSVSETRPDFPTDVSTFVYLHKDRLSLRSDAALDVCRHVPFPHNIPRIFRIVPRFVRDAIYNFVARNRIRWFGKQETCPIYPDHIEARFLDSTAS